MRMLFLALTLPLFGVWVGNPADPALMNSGFLSTTYPFFKCTSGYIYDYTSEIPLESGKEIGLHSKMGSFSVILVERLQLFGAFGTTRETIAKQSLSDMVLEPHTSYHFSWTAGGKVVLWQWGQTFLSTDFTYFSVPTSVNSYLELLNVFTGATSTEKFSLSEYQFSAALSSRLYFITPYAGLDYMWLDLDAERITKNSRNFGYFYGITVSLSGKLHLNFERRMRDEFAYTFSTTAVF